MTKAKAHLAFAAITVLLIALGVLCVSPAAAITYTYDAHGRLTTADYDGGYITYTYDDAGNIINKAVVSANTLTVTKAGTGSGTVTDDKGKLTCSGNTCTGAYPLNSSVTLTADPAPNSTFASWKDCTSVNGTICTVTMAANKTVSATFTPKPLSAITSLTPASGVIGAAVTIKGTNFGTNQGTVTFNNISAPVALWSNTSITCTVPVGATTGPVVVTNQVGSSAGRTFTVKPPVIASLTPAAGTIGTAVTIAGTYFGPSQGSSTVTFSGVSATVSTWSNTSIKCTVPAGATTGPVVVMTSVGSSAGRTFTVKPPVISLLTPASGTVGTAVTVAGTFFGPSQGSSTVTFSGVSATVSTWSNTSIKCHVPDGATTGPVVVTTPVGSSAGRTFTVKP